jgi:thiol-disulfide isomerase/thioredoxin
MPSNQNNSLLNCKIMKTLTSVFLSVILPLLGMSQANSFELIKLKTLDEKNVDLEEKFQESELTLLYFFNEDCRNLTDQLDYLENLAEEYSDIQLKIIAVYNANNTSSYGQIKPFIHGYDINIETLIDVNGELQRSMGLPVNSTVIITRYTNIPSGSYMQSVSYSPEQAEVELSQLLSGDLCHYK